METRERIVDAARSLRYRPNALARGLRTRRTDTIGLIIPSLDNVGFSEVTHGIQAAAAAAGKLVMVVEADALRWTADGNPDHYARMITDGRLDGLIVAFATLDDHFVTQLAERNLPLVLVNRRTVGLHGSVVVDDESGSVMAVQHLIGLGHHRIGLVGLEAETDTARRREQGYRRAMSDGARTIDEAWIANAAPNEAGGREAIARLLGIRPDRRPTAIFAASLLGAIGVLAGVREAGFGVPADISLIAFNDHPLAAHLSPPLTTIRMPNHRMGMEAVRMLLDAVDGKPVYDLMVHDKVEIIIRLSTASPAH
ncbi:MAG: LacI family DNA-binding transcriptional regulator [Candidatus Dormibacteraceae bacterium]